MPDTFAGRYISYREWMESVLYHPKSGFYISGRFPIGKKGDFITAAGSRAFARGLCLYFSNIIGKNRLPQVFCEVGSGDGSLAERFIKEWGQTSPQNCGDFRYYSVEISPRSRRLQQERISHPGFTAVSRPEEVEPFEGILFSNEFFDALPVHVVMRCGGKLYEVLISVTGSRLEEHMGPLRDEEVLVYLERFPDLEIPEGHHVEIPICMLKTYRSMARPVKRGFLITIDYGYRFSELRRAIYREGSMRGYHDHRMVDVRRVPFACDMTCHIHFDVRVKKGIRLGFSGWKLM